MLQPASGILDVCNSCSVILSRYVVYTKIMTPRSLLTSNNFSSWLFTYGEYRICYKHSRHRFLMLGFRSAESWTPICLPKFNDTGFLHAHVSYLPRDSPACLLLISTDKEKFFALQEVQKKIVEVLYMGNCVYMQY